MNAVTGVTSKESVRELVNHAKGFEKVIRCTTPEGREVQYLPYLAESIGGVLWVRHAPDGGAIVEEPTVCNMVLLCRPDVEIIELEESAFAGDS